MDELTTAAKLQDPFESAIMATPLSLSTLSDLPSNVRVPSYARADLTPGIVHIGLGHFHRSHQAWYLHRLMDHGLAHDWAIFGACLRHADAAARLYSLCAVRLTPLLALHLPAQSRALPAVRR